MKPLNFIKLLVLFTFALFHSSQTHACSMCKITANGKTLVGNNEDYWSSEARIWFSNGDANNHGVAYVGHSRKFPQGAINEAGLVFDGFALYAKDLGTGENKIPVGDKQGLIEETMKKCSTVFDVGKYLEKYNLSCFKNSMIWFIDKNGDHLIVESDTLIYGTQSSYALTNFRPSETPDPEKVNIPKYQRALSMLKTEKNPTIAFVASVMDTMKTCDKPLGDGTLYTTIYDLKETTIYLYFYHDFRHFVKLDLEKELAQGDHTLAISELFKENKEYSIFLAYKTPFNSKLVFYLMTIIIGLTGFLTIYFLIVIFMNVVKRNSRKNRIISSITSIQFIVVNGIILILSCFYLLSEIVYYMGIEKSLMSFPFPSIKYFPLIIMLFLAPIFWCGYRIFRTTEMNRLFKLFYSVNSSIYLVFILLNIYWGLLII